MIFVGDLTDVAVCIEISKPCRHINNCDPFDQRFGLPAVDDQIGNCDDLKVDVFLYIPSVGVHGPWFHLHS